MVSSEQYLLDNHLIDAKKRLSDVECDFTTTGVLKNALVGTLISCDPAIRVLNAEKENIRKICKVLLKWSAPSYKRTTTMTTTVEKKKIRYYIIVSKVLQYLKKVM